MRAVRGLLLGPKYTAIIDDLEKGLRVSRRTAERVYAGQSVGADAAFSVLTHPGLGGPLLEEVLRRVPEDRRAVVAKALKTAAEIVLLEAEQRQIALNIEELKRRA